MLLIVEGNFLIPVGKVCIARVFWWLKNRANLALPIMNCLASFPRMLQFAYICCCCCCLIFLHFTELPRLNYKYIA